MAMTKAAPPRKESVWSATIEGIGETVVKVHTRVDLPRKFTVLFADSLMDIGEREVNIIREERSRRPVYHIWFGANKDFTSFVRVTASLAPQEDLDR
jgi:hypothetical protein